MYKKNICDYGTMLDLKEAARLGAEVLALTKSWRERLGTKQDLLDNYLLVVLTVLSETMNANAALKVGFEEIMPKFRGLCRYIKEGGNSEAEEHPFYPTLKNYTDTHSILLDSLFYESCCVGTFKEYTEFATHWFIEEHDKKLRERLDKDELPEMRKMILLLNAGFTEDDIDGLLERLISLFILVSPASVFIQGIVDQIIMSFLLQDKATGDYVFQRLLNGVI